MAGLRPMRPAPRLLADVRETETLRGFHALAALSLIAGRLKPAFNRALHTAAHDALDDRLKSEGYDARQRSEIEDLVEKSR